MKANTGTIRRRNAEPRADRPLSGPPDAAAGTASVPHDCVETCTCTRRPARTTTHTRDETGSGQARPGIIHLGSELLLQRGLLWLLGLFGEFLAVLRNTENQIRGNKMSTRRFDLSSTDTDL